MESSAPKRRRTSPRTAVPLHPPAQLESTTPKESPPKPADGPNRPSFASPTRASLQRFNPDILRRRTLSPKRKRPAEQDAPPSASRPSSAQSNDSLSQALAAHLATQQETNKDEGDGAAGPSNAPDTSALVGLRLPAPRAGSVRDQTSQTAAADDDDDDLLNPFAGRALARSPRGIFPGSIMAEPELPPTPEHPDPVVSTPPSGIHNTPSKRPKRSKELAEKLKSSSPLKQPVLRPSKGLWEKPAHMSGRPSVLRRSSSPQPLSTSQLRGITLVDPNQKKKRVRDWLRSQVEELEHDLEIAITENDRIQKANSSKLDLSPPPNKGDIINLLRRSVITTKDGEPEPNPTPDSAPLWLQLALNPIAFLPFSKAVPHGTDGPWIDFFSTRERPPADHPENPLPSSHHPVRLTAAETLPYLQLFTPLTFDNYTYPLQRKNESASSDEPLVMHHTIFVRSQAPLYGLFTAKIEMNVNTKTLAVTELTVERLDPAAVSELTPFIKGICGGGGMEDCPNSSALTFNVSVLGWGMAEWLRIAIRRAKFWKVLEEELNSGVKRSVNLRKMVREFREGREKEKASGGGGKKKNNLREPSLRRRRGDGDDEEGEEEEEEEQSLEDQTMVLMGQTRAIDLIAFMGQTGMDYTIPLLNAEMGKGKRVVSDEEVEAGVDLRELRNDNNLSTLRVRWRIELDWTGEARSNISVLAGVPEKWHQFDERGRLCGISKLFDDLIQGGEAPLTAVRTVVSLLAGEPREDVPEIEKPGEREMWRE